MLRWLYIQLLWLHPAAFRQRFGDEMLEIFDCAAGSRPSLLADGVVSLMRQWFLRREFHEPESMPAEAPFFRGIEPYQPHPAALLDGGLLAIVILCGMVTAIGHGGKAAGFSIGSHRAGLGLISMAGTNPDTTVKVASEPDDPFRPAVVAYFRMVRVLGALDANQDLAISRREILNAAAALRKLDTDRDGSLSAEECGYRARPGRTPREFMRVNPVLAALDTDGDGEISAAEIVNAPASLKKLDRNGDGVLTFWELLPIEAWRIW